MWVCVNICIYHPNLVILIGNLGYLIQWEYIYIYIHTYNSIWYEPFPATPTTFCSTTVRTLACPPWAAMDAASLQDRLHQIESNTPNGLDQLDQIDIPSGELT